MTTTFNPAKTESHITLTNGNLTATASLNGAYQNTEGSSTQSTGKYYAEVHVDQNPAPGCLGIANATASLSNFAGNDTNSIGWVNDGRQLLGAVSLPNIASWTTGDTLSMAVDLGAQKIWFRKNAGGWNNDVIANQNPATGVGGTSISGLAAGPYALIFTLNGNGTAATANFGTTTFAQSVPSGFIHWDGTSGGGVTGTWASTGPTDAAIVFGNQPNSGPLSVTESADSWATFPGFARLEVEAAGNPFSATTFNISTFGPNRVIVLVGGGVGVTGLPDQITAISDAAGLTWHQEYFLGYGPDEFSDNAVVQLWWAYAHNQLTNDAVTVTINGGSTSTSYVVDYIVIKGLNGNYNAPFDRVNPLSFGTAIGALFSPPDPQTAPATFMPIATGPLGGGSPGHTSLTGAVGATLTGSNLTITSSGASPPNNYAKGVAADGLSNGTVYFESKFANIAGTHYGFGVIFDETDPTLLVSNGAGGAICRGDGSIWTGASAGSLGDTPAANDIIACAVDIPKRLVWFKNVTQAGQWNGALNGDPFHGTGGIAITHIALNGVTPIHSVGRGANFQDMMLPISVVDGTSSSAQQVLNFGATSYTGTAPSGFLSWAGAAAGTTHVPYPSIVIGATFAVRGDGTFGATEAPPGFTQNALRQIVGSQRSVSLSLHTKVCSQNILLSDNEMMQQADTAQLWGMLYMTAVVGTTDPGSLESTEAADVFHGVGHPGAAGIVGDLTTTGSPDIFNANGFERDSGVLATTETTDIFSAFGFQPLTGVWHSTENKDIFAATGIGRGEDGRWNSTESVDIFSAIGHSPVSGTFVGVEAPDRFEAIGAGVTRVRRRRPFYVT